MSTLKTYRVHGICFIPAEAVFTAQARSPEEALAAARKAWDREKRNLIIGGSEDESSAHSWEPSVKEDS